jgi:hypothetical protein
MHIIPDLQQAVKMAAEGLAGLTSQFSGGALPCEARRERTMK